MLKFLWFGPAIATGLAVPISVLCVAMGFRSAEAGSTAVVLLFPAAFLVSICVPREIRTSSQGTFKVAIVGVVVAALWSVLSLAAFLNEAGPLLRLFEFVFRSS